MDFFNVLHGSVATDYTVPKNLSVKVTTRMFPSETYIVIDCNYNRSMALLENELSKTREWVQFGEIKQKYES